MKLALLCCCILISACAPASQSVHQQQLELQALQQQCLHIKSSYPFSITSDRELSLQEFEDYFFAKGSAAVNSEQFFKKLSFYKYDELNGNNKRLYQHLMQIDKIRQAFYLSGKSRPSFTFKIKTQTIAKHVYDFYLSLNEGQGLKMLGPRFYHHYTWSALALPMTLSIKFSDDSEWMREFTGNWAPFRFLDSGIININSKPYIIEIESNNKLSLEFILEDIAFYKAIRQHFDCPNFTYLN